MVKSKQVVHQQGLLEKFADMAEQSKSLDGDWQGDGWGISYFDTDSNWKSYHSLKPVWKERQLFATLPKTSAFLVHARSASFDHHTGKLSYSQPFVYGKYAFVFNGLLKGVALPYSVPGEIGSQKIWQMIANNIEKFGVEKSIDSVVSILEKYSQSIQACNIGISDGTTLHSYSSYKAFPEYYNVKCYSSDGLVAVCSEELRSLHFDNLPTNKVIIM